MSAVGGCTRNEPAHPPLFGGRGASIASEAPLPAATAVPVNAGPCGASAPAGEGTLIDDFEDGDAKPFKAFQREGWWYTATDDSAGGVVHPKPGAFSAEQHSESRPDNRLALHLRAQGFTSWGVVWGTTLAWVKDGVKCPFNAERFAGVRLRAKGPSTLTLKVSLPETVAKENGGSCTTSCHDLHGKVIVLDEGWQDVEVRWDRLQQGGWGVDARFDPKRIIGLSFAVDPKQQPIDAWLDDVEFIPAATPSSAATAPHQG